MPGLDRTGSRGMGPMTGGRRGRCNPNADDAERSMTRSTGFRRGMGYRRQYGAGYGYRGGFGWAGYRHRPMIEDYPADDLEALNDSLEKIKRRISELEKK